MSLFKRISKQNFPPLFLAPMDGVTDMPFRYLCKMYGADFVVTEFISIDGILRKENHFAEKINFLPFERPIGIQLFGNDPVKLHDAIQIVSLVAPNFIDLNFGCPVKKIVSKGAGAALLSNLPLMEKLARAAVLATDIPITAKTRIGIDENNINIKEVVLRLQDCGVSAITIHGRTKKQMYKGEANWEIIAQVRNDKQVYVPIIGNGDINSPQKAEFVLKNYPVDGLMIGRGAIGNPFIFKQIKQVFKGEDPEIFDIHTKIQTVKKHIELALQWMDERKTIIQMRKHYSAYFRAYYNFKEFKLKLMQAKTIEEVFEILNQIEDYYSNNEN